MWHTCGREEEHNGLWWGKLMEGDHLEDLGVDGGIQRKWILKRRRGCEMDSPASEYDQVAGCCVNSDEPSSSIKCDKSD